MTDPISRMQARLQWRVQGGWERIEAHDARGLEAVDRADRRIRIFPGEEGAGNTEGGYFGTVKYVGERGHGVFHGAITDTWGETPEEAVRRGIERLDDRLEEIAERRKELEAPSLGVGVSGGGTSKRDESGESGANSTDSADESTNSAEQKALGLEGYDG